MECPCTLLGRTVQQRLQKPSVEDVVVAARDHFAAAAGSPRLDARVHLLHYPGSPRHGRTLLQPGREADACEVRAGGQVRGIDGGEDCCAGHHLPVAVHAVTNGHELRSLSTPLQVGAVFCRRSLLKRPEVVLLDHHRHQVSVDVEHVHLLIHGNWISDLLVTDTEEARTGVKGGQHHLRVLLALRAIRSHGPEELGVVDDLADISAASFDYCLDRAGIRSFALALQDRLHAFGDCCARRTLELDVIAHGSQVAHLLVLPVVADADDRVSRGLDHVDQSLHAS
mmetsp:Transcript_21832/g.65134  ORF Transcript_21832/g.65134 Transcript_21832/m.65134 type:complete len:283 (-) Transcript_21832:530-1378(-)